MAVGRAGSIYRQIEDCMKFLLKMFVVLTAAGLFEGAVADPLQTAFCPAGSVRSYPLSGARRLDSLLLHNALIINRGTAPVTLTNIDIQLLSKGVVMEEIHLSGATLTNVAAAGPAIQQSGMLKTVPFQFCGDAMVQPGVTLVGTTLAANQALLIIQQAFAYHGIRDTLRVVSKGTSEGMPIESTADLPIVGGFAKNSYIFPLRGAWYAGVGPSFFTGHRWAIPEQFAFDIAQIGATGRTYKTDGRHFADYYAYGADVLAAASGKVIVAKDGLAEDPGAMRRPDEAPDTYMQRLVADQAKRLAGGTHAIAGNYVMIDHGNGEYSLSAHLQPGSLRVKLGDRVTRGQVIGKLGSSGNSTEPHLHFQLCDAPDALMCTGIPIQFTNIEIPWADGTRELQSGDIVIAK